jgi:hypothetical protein
MAFSRSSAVNKGQAIAAYQSFCTVRITRITRLGRFLMSDSYWRHPRFELRGRGGHYRSTRNGPSLSNCAADTENMANRSTKADTMRIILSID